MSILQERPIRVNIRSNRLCVRLKPVETHPYLNSLVDSAVYYWLQMDPILCSTLMT